MNFWFEGERGRERRRKDRFFCSTRMREPEKGANTREREREREPKKEGISNTPQPNIEQQCWQQFVSAKEVTRSDRRTLPFKQFSTRMKNTIVFVLQWGWKSEKRLTHKNGHNNLHYTLSGSLIEWTHKNGHNLHHTLSGSLIEWLHSKFTFSRNMIQIHFLDYTFLTVDFLPVKWFLQTSGHRVHQQKALHGESTQSLRFGTHGTDPNYITRIWESCNLSVCGVRVGELDGYIIPCPPFLPCHRHIHTLYLEAIISLSSNHTWSEWLDPGLENSSRAATATTHKYKTFKDHGKRLQ